MTQNDKEHGHQVTVTINGNDKQVQSKEWKVADLKAALGVDAALELEQIISGTLTPLAEDGKVHVKGGEKFVSHVRAGGSS